MKPSPKHCTAIQKEKEDCHNIQDLLSLSQPFCQERVKTKFEFHTYVECKVQSSICILVDSNEEHALMDHHMLSISSGMKVDQNIYQGLRLDYVYTYNKNTNGK